MPVSASNVISIGKAIVQLYRVYAEVDVQLERWGKSLELKALGLQVQSLGEELEALQADQEVQGKLVASSN